MLAWRETRYELIDYEVVKLAQDVCAQCANSPTRSHFTVGYNQVGLIALLKDKLTNERLIVSTTHITANWLAPHVQLAQVQAFLRRIEKFSQKHECANVVMAGDLNSKPCSGVYDLLRYGHLDQEHKDLSELKTIGIEMPYPNLEHGLDFESAYKVILGEEPTQTTYTGSFQGTLDYVWYSNRSLIPLSVLDVHPMSELKREVAMPSLRFPSDHLPMLSRFRFHKESNGELDQGSNDSEPA